MDSFFRFQLGDLVEIVTGATPSSREPDSWGNYIEFVTPSDQVSGQREALPARGLSEIGSARLAKRVVPAQSTNLTCIGSTIGKVTMAARPCVTNQQINSLIARRGVADPRFIYYMISNWSSQLRQDAAGSATPIINKSVLARYEFDTPPLVQQQAIGEVLGALDDKIAANDGLISLCAELRAAKFRGSLMAGEVMELRIADATTMLTRGIAPKYTEDLGGILVLNQKCVRGHAVNRDLGRRTESSRIRPEKVLRRDDVLVNSTGVGTLGRTARWTVDTEAIVDSHITIVRFDPAVVDPAAAGLALLMLEPTIESMGEGSTGQTELSRTKLGELTIRLPARAHHAELGRMIANLDSMENAHREESRRLAALRDTLLPHLMSGRLRVKDAERQVEAVV